MWINPNGQMCDRLRPAIVSHGYTMNTGDSGGLPRSTAHASGKQLSSYIWDGCRDYAALLCVPSTLNMWENMPGGISGCRQYNRTLLDQAVNLLMSEWNLADEDMPCPLNMRSSSPMALVPLPKQLSQLKNTGLDIMESGATDRHAYSLQELLHHKFFLEVPVKCLEGRIYVRISAHVYNTIDDYVKLAMVINSLK